VANAAHGVHAVYSVSKMGSGAVHAMYSVRKLGKAQCVKTLSGGCDR
jgi:hypothetical protein